MAGHWCITAPRPLGHERHGDTMWTLTDQEQFVMISDHASHIHNKLPYSGSHNTIICSSDPKCEEKVQHEIFVLA